MVEFGHFKTSLWGLTHFEWPRGKQQFFLLFFFNPKTALSEAPEASMIFSQYTVFVKTFYQTTYSGKSTEVIL